MAITLWKAGCCKMKFKKSSVVALALAAVIGFVGTGIGYATAYLTDQGPTMINPFTIALDTRTTVVEKFPEPDISGKVINYEKQVQIGNVGFVDGYVRVHLDFTDSDVEGWTEFSPDNGAHWYSVSDYKNHLPEGWIWKDGFYIYTPILYAGDWDETMHPQFIYDNLLGEYFYNDGQNIVSSPMLTTPLITRVRTTFPTEHDMRSYQLSVNEESVPFYFGTDAVSAFEAYDQGLMSGGKK